MPEVGSSIGRCESVAESRTRGDGALRDHGHTVHVRRVSHVKAVPVDAGSLSEQVVLQVHDHFVTLADLQRRTHNPSFFMFSGFESYGLLEVEVAVVGVDNSEI